MKVISSPFPTFNSASFVSKFNSVNYVDLVGCQKQEDDDRIQKDWQRLQRYENRARQNFQKGDQQTAYAYLSLADSIHHRYLGKMYSLKITESFLMTKVDLIFKQLDQGQIERDKALYEFAKVIFANVNFADVILPRVIHYFQTAGKDYKLLARIWGKFEQLRMESDLESIVHLSLLEKLAHYFDEEELVQLIVYFLQGYAVYTDEEIKDMIIFLSEYSRESLQEFLLRIKAKAESYKREESLYQFGLDVL